MPGRAGVADQLVAGIGDQRRAGVADQRHRLGRRASRPGPRRAPCRHCDRDRAVIGRFTPIWREQLGGDPACPRPRSGRRARSISAARGRQIAEIADRGGDDIEAGGERLVHRERRSWHCNPTARQARRACSLPRRSPAAIAGCCARLPEPAPRLPIEPVLGPSRRADPRLPADETRNRVAVLVPLTGRDAALGQSIPNAANLALLDTGEQAHPDHRLRHRRPGRRRRRGQRGDRGGQRPDPRAAARRGRARGRAGRARAPDVPVIAFSNDDSVAGDGVYLMGFTPGQSIGRVVAYRALARRKPLRRAGPDRTLWPARGAGDARRGAKARRAAGRHPDLRPQRRRRSRAAARRLERPRARPTRC